MSDLRGTGFADRLKAAAEARQALLDKLKPKPTVTAPETVNRADARKAELEQVRKDRADAKAARKQAALDGAAATQQALDDAAAADLESKRGARKERKALTKAEAKAKRDARYAARKARQ